MERRLTTLVDVMRVPVDGDVGVALVDTTAGRDAPQPVACEILVAGGGTGGVAAALAALEAGRSVCLLEETDWLGGQLTAQGVSALDEHEHIETFGGTASYYRLREAIRDAYRPLARDPSALVPFNPGNCWVTRLAFEPRVAAACFDRLLRPFEATGQLRLFRRAKVHAVASEGDRIVAVEALALDGRESWRFTPDYVIDATELGDLLPLCGADYVVGAETVADTGEAHAQPREPKPRCVQSYTYILGLELAAEGEDHTIPKPPRYDHFRATQPYSLTIEVHGGEIYGEESGWLSYRTFETLPGTKGSLWTYRRLVDRAHFPSYPRDLAIVNWPGNDYREASLLEVEPRAQAQALQDGKRVSLGFLHWLQTEGEATATRRGAPEIRLQPAVMDSADGLSKYPYIRESRRIRALKTVVEQEVSAEFQAGPRAAHFDDSVGIGWYPIDIHRSGPEDVGHSCRTRPFQIPLGALIPRRVTNLLAAAKNIGVTHLTNGCYRLHPVEWNIGEAAGLLAAVALESGRSPAAIGGDRASLRAFQDRLLAAGVPLAWLIDVGTADPAFAVAQRLFRDGRLTAPDSLAIGLGRPITAAEWQAWGGQGPLPATRGEGLRRLASG
jgi:hypothetical protein